MKTLKSILCIILCLSFALSLCSCGRMSGRYFGYSAKTIYCEDGYESEYAYQLWRYEEYINYRFFGVPLLSYSERSYTYLNPNGKVTDITFVKDHEDRENFLTLLPEDQLALVDRQRGFVLYTLPEGLYGIFFDDVPGQSSLELNSNQSWYSVRMYKYDESKSLFYTSFEVPIKESGRLKINLTEEYFGFNNFIWLDYELHEVSGEPNVKIDEEYSISNVKSWLKQCNDKAVDKNVEDISNIVTFKRLDDIYYFRLKGSDKIYILETDLNKNVKRFVSFEMPTNGVSIYRAYENGKKYEYYDIYGEENFYINAI